MFKIKVKEPVWLLGCYTASVRLRPTDMVTHVFDTMDDVCSWIRNSFYTRTNYNDYNVDYRTINWLMHGEAYFSLTDLYDIPIHPYVVEHHYTDWLRRQGNKPRHNRFSGRIFEYRYDPVPGTGKKGGRRWWRKSKPILNVKQKLMDPLLRPKASIEVDPWDEGRRRSTERNWKKQRRHQWKG